MSNISAPDLSGLWVPIITPFHADGALDVPSLERLAEQLLDGGARGLVALGTTGEPATLDADERRRVVEVCAHACRRAQRGLMLGAGTNSTAGTLDEVRMLTDGVEADALLIVAPYYTRPSEEAIVDHFGIVADASPSPIVIYNIPHRTGRGLAAAALCSAAEHPNTAGLKQSVGGVDEDTLDVLRSAPPGFTVLAGDDAFIVPTMLMGGGGAIAAAAHLCTASFATMVTAAQNGAIDQAVRLAHLLLPVVRSGFAEPSPAVWKGALAERGVIASPAVRRPMREASAQAIAELLSAAAL